MTRRLFPPTRRYRPRPETSSPGDPPPRSTPPRGRRGIDRVPIALALLILLALSACSDPGSSLIGKSAQSIQFPVLVDRVTTDPPFQASATATSGLPVAFAADGVCSVAGATVTLSGSVGTCTVTASQPGNGRYEPADDVTRAFEVREDTQQNASQSISFDRLPDRLASDPPFDLEASASSGLPVGFAADGTCSVDGATVTLTGAIGTCTITASQAGGDGYEPADDVARSFLTMQPVDRVGFVLLDESGTEDARTIGASGTFNQRTEPVGEAQLSDPFGEQLGRCEVTTTGDAPAIDDPLDDATGTPLSAGGPLQVRHGGAAYATLTSAEPGAYQLDGTAPAAPLADASLTLDVPGHAFPAFASAPFVDAPAFALDDAVDPDAVTRDTSFVWEPGGSAASLALFVGGDGDTLFSCAVADDGGFAFDEATRSALDAAGFDEGALHLAGRLTLGATVDGDAALLLGVLRLTSFGAAPPAALHLSTQDAGARDATQLADIVEAVATGSAPTSHLAARLLRHSR